MADEKRPNEGRPNFELKVRDPFTDKFVSCYTPYDATDVDSGINKLSDATDNSVLNAQTGMTAATPKAVYDLQKININAGTVTPNRTLANERFGDTSEAIGSIPLDNIDASKITEGTIDPDRLPEGTLNKLVIVANDTERLALTTEEVDRGDSVFVTETTVMYYVSDPTKLGTEHPEDAFQEYAAGIAEQVQHSLIMPDKNGNTKQEFNGSKTVSFQGDTNIDQDSNNFITSNALKGYIRHFGRCSTPSETATKVVTISSISEYYHNGEKIIGTPFGYEITDSEKVSVNTTGITVTTEVETEESVDPPVTESVTTEWGNVTQSFIDELISESCIAECNFSDADFCSYQLSGSSDTNTKFDIVSTFSLKNKNNTFTPTHGSLIYVLFDNKFDHSSMNIQINGIPDPYPVAMSAGERCAAVANSMVGFVLEKTNDGGFQWQRIDSAPSSFGVCDTAETNGTKAVTADGFSWVDGTLLAVYFSRSNLADNSGGTSSDPLPLKMVVNNNTSDTGNIIKYRGNDAVGNNAPVWRSGETILFAYKNGNWEMVSNLGCYNTLGVCESAADASEKVVTNIEMSGFYIRKGAVVNISFTHGNTATGLSLKIKGAVSRPIYYNGAPVSSTNTFKIKAKDVIPFIYDGTNWVFIGRREFDVDITYPVGSYYFTSDNSFVPDTAWGGTWEKIPSTLGPVTWHRVS